MKDDSVYLAHILESIHNLQTMAESTQRVSPTLKATQPQIEWQSIVAFRNVLVHDYLGIDIRLIWQVTQRDIPELKRAVLVMQSSLLP